MENIQLLVEDLPDTETVNYAQILEDVIPDDATCISVKVNIPEYDPSDNNFVAPGFADIKAYLLDSGVEILAHTSGIHLQGKKEIPHIHYHFVARHYNPPSNASQHRKRWLAKEGNEMRSLQDATFKYQAFEYGTPKYQFLSYPLKEGKHSGRRHHYQFLNGNMEKPMIMFLIDVGQAIFAKQSALRLRQERHAERRQLAYAELCDLVRDLTFTNFNELCDWFDENYLYKLAEEDIPDPKSYKTNIRKIGIKHRLLKTRDLS